MVLSPAGWCSVQCSRWGSFCLCLGEVDGMSDLTGEAATAAQQQATRTDKHSSRRTGKQTKSRNARGPRSQRRLCIYKETEREESAATGIAFCPGAGIQPARQEGGTHSSYCCLLCAEPVYVPAYLLPAYFLPARCFTPPLFPAALPFVPFLRFLFQSSPPPPRTAPARYTHTHTHTHTHSHLDRYITSRAFVTMQAPTCLPPPEQVTPCAYLLSCAILLYRTPSSGGSLFELDLVSFFNLHLL